MHSDTWQVNDKLLSKPRQELSIILENFPKLLQKIWPLNSTHKKSLPEDIAELSRILTCERHELSRPYWSKAKFISAYLWYFLPWNILRLSRIIPKLPITTPNSSLNLILTDIGSGPLTLPITLWLSKKELQELKIQVLATDNTIKPLSLGKKLFIEIGNFLEKPIWKIHIEKCNTEFAHKKIIQFTQNNKDTQKIWLISATNTLNELENEQLAMILNKTIFNIKSEYILIVEPGTRFGGNLIMQIRDLAIQSSLKVLSPCTHQNLCPLLKSPLSKTWCHFTFDTLGAPNWLLELSEKSGLAKNALSLSPLFLSKKEPINSYSARVISNAFKVPNIQGMARYACSAHGLNLIEKASNIEQGSVISILKEQIGGIDKKSGAKIAHIPKK